MTGSRSTGVRWLLIGMAFVVLAATSACDPPSVPGPPAWETYRNETFGLVLRYPARWQSTRAHTGLPHFEGRYGFVDVDVFRGEGLRLRAACRLQMDHPAESYGRHPRLSTISVDGTRACLIWPSWEPGYLKGPAAIVVARHADPLDGWSYLVIDADKNHVSQIASRIELFTATRSPPDWKTYRNDEDGLLMRYPAEWHSAWIRNGDSPYFQGYDGFVVPDLLNGGRRDLRSACTLLTENTVHPYGTEPRLSTIKVGGRRACLIWPSRDQEPLEDEVATIVVRRDSEPQDHWKYLIISADKSHIRQIAARAELFTVEWETPTPTAS